MSIKVNWTSDLSVETENKTSYSDSCLIESYDFVNYYKDLTNMQ